MKKWKDHCPRWLPWASRNRPSTSKGRWQFVLVNHCNKGQIKCLRHSDFKVDSENANFKLYLGPEVYRKGLSISEKISPLSNMPFTTIDRDNDIYSQNCAQLHHGGWWHGQCFYSICPNCEPAYPKGCPRTFLAMKPM